jgi:hypothetical protein
MLIVIGTTVGILPRNAVTLNPVERQVSVIRSPHALDLLGCNENKF